ncbi:unnamed protein product [Aureobasidium uvarum]|uniref:Uncharacterized protein n=1 Tax=Aureobasidium uvarum TaxID=2773716 RepID=A0A9N8KLW4_9PEZI|nr:unnamed protein product [Aureobasidium uvarum]
MRRNADDTATEMYLTKAKGWVPGADVPPELLRAWVESNPPSRRSGIGSDAEVNGVRRVQNGELEVNYKKNGKNEAGNLWNFTWVPASVADPEKESMFAKFDKESVERDMEVLSPGPRLSGLETRLNMLDDLLDEVTVEIVKPLWVSGSPPPAVHDTKIPAHTPHYALPIPFQGCCDDAARQPDTLTHSTLVAACQSTKHLPNTLNFNASRHLICTTCHETPPIHRLTQREKTHLIRDKGLLPLCISYAEWWCNVHDISSEKDGNYCTCKQQVAQWLCADCWVEVARARGRTRDEIQMCDCAQDQGARAVMSEIVRICSGCRGLVVNRGGAT